MSSMPPPGRGVALRWLRSTSAPDLLQIGCLLALFAAIFSGRFSFVRFADELARADWLQLRIWFTALAALGWLVLQRQGGEARRGLGKGLTTWIVLLALFYLCLLGNLLLIGNDASAPQQLADILITALQAFLVIQIVRSENDLIWFARIAESAGVALFLFCIAGFGNPDLNGHGWAPFGGPITFYRIQFLAFCCALYLFARDGKSGAFVHLAVAAIALFSTLASLSKVAFVAAAAAAALMVFWLLSTRQWRQAVTIGVVVSLAFCAFQFQRGELFAARVSKGLLTSEVALPDANWTTGLLRRIESGEELRLADLPAWQQHHIRALTRVPDPEKVPLRSLLRDQSRVIVYEDNTDRARLWGHAWDLYRSKPWFGVGIGNYAVELVNRYSGQFERYRYPHNIALELAASTGVTGLTLFAVLVFVSFVLLQQRVMAIPALLYVTAYPWFVLITALAAGDPFDFRVFWLFTLIVLAASAGDAGVPISAASTRIRTRGVPSVDSNG